MTLIARMRNGIGARAGFGTAIVPLRRLRLSATLSATAGLVLSAALLAPLAAEGQGQTDHPVLLELYTAQGCASCPPADDMLVDLASREDVIALALHVDYWDYIGWADTFASRGNTERQQRYARRHGHSTIYTPQVIVNGTQIVEGFRIMEVMDTIARQQERAGEVEITLQRSDAGLTIRAVPTEEAAPQIAMASRRLASGGMATNSVVGTLTMRAPAPAAAGETSGDAADDAGAAAVTAEAAPPAAAAGAALGRPGVGPYSVQLVRYQPIASVDILGGENAGRSAQYANIVTSWQDLGSWDMMAPIEVTVPLDGPEPAVVVVQEAGQGEVVATARLR